MADSNEGDSDLTAEGISEKCGVVILDFCRDKPLFMRVIVDGTILDYKAAGNDLIKQGKYAEAADKYTQVTPARKKKYTEKQ